MIYPTAFRRLDSISIQLYFYTYNVLGVLSGMFSLVKGISVRREVKEILGGAQRWDRRPVGWPVVFLDTPKNCTKIGLYRTRHVPNWTYRGPIR